MLSVVIPTHDRQSLVLRTLAALRRQEEVAGGFEVLVIADGCEDGTAQAILRTAWPFPIRVFEQPQSGQAAARNRGATEATGDAIVFLDDDMVPAPQFLREIRRELDAGADGVLSTVRQGDWSGDSIFAREVRGWDREIHDVLAADRIEFDNVLFCAHAVRRDKFWAAGGFDEAFTAGGAYGNEDVELGHRLLQLGARFRYCPAAIAETEAVTDPLLLLRRARQIARNDLRLLEKHPELAPAVFGRKFRFSRIHRALAPLILVVPWVSTLAVPARTLLVLLVRRNRTGAWAYRLWFSVRAAEYWRAVADAGGAKLALRARAEALQGC